MTRPGDNSEMKSNNATYTWMREEYVRYHLIISKGCSHVLEIPE